MADGTQVAFNLAYRYNNVQVTVNGVAKTVGVDFLNDPADYDCLYNFEEKLVKFRDDNKPSASQVVKVFGNAYIPLIVQAADDASIAAYGRREGIEINKSITSLEEAELLAQSLIDKWREGSKEGQFKTRETGLRVGQTITINSTILGINDSYKINRITGQLNDHDSFEYTVQFIKSGEVTFTDMMVELIGKDKDNIVISDNEVLQRLLSISDTFGMTDEIVEVKKSSAPYTYFNGLVRNLVKALNFSNNGYLTIATPPTLTSTYWFSLWLKPAEIGRLQDIVNLRGAGTYPRFGLWSNNKLLVYCGDEQYTIIS